MMDDIPAAGAPAGVADAEADDGTTCDDEYLGLARRIPPPGAFLAGPSPPVTFASAISLGH